MEEESSDKVIEEEALLEKHFLSQIVYVRFRRRATLFCRRADTGIERTPTSILRSFGSRSSERGEKDLRVLKKNEIFISPALLYVHKRCAH